MCSRLGYASRQPCKETRSHGGLANSGLSEASIRPLCSRAHAWPEIVLGPGSRQSCKQARSHRGPLPPQRTVGGERARTGDIAPGRCGAILCGGGPHGHVYPAHGSRKVSQLAARCDAVWAPQAAHRQGRVCRLLPHSVHLLNMGESRAACAFSRDCWHRSWSAPFRFSHLFFPAPAHQLSRAHLVFPPIVSA